MKLKAIVTINMGLYMDIRPEIEIDTENIEESKNLVRSLHKHFYKLLEVSKPITKSYKPKKDLTEAKNSFESDLQVAFEESEAETK